jgi:hypothetical protein
MQRPRRVESGSECFVCSAPITAAPKGLARTLGADIPVSASVDRNGWFADLPRMRMANERCKWSKDGARLK